MDLGLLRIRAWSKDMVLRLATDEVQELRRALTARYSEVLHELSQAEGFFSSTRGRELCRRKWKLEALLHQFDYPGNLISF